MISGEGFASRPWLIVPLTSALHLSYSFGLFADIERISRITVLHFSYLLFGRALPIVLFFVATLALIPMFTPTQPKTIHLYLWPQQFMLAMMSASALTSAYVGHYPDGYKTEHMFIFLDQCWVLWLMAAHLAAMIRNARISWSS